jgi:GT2 family glycosyltransferase
MSSVTVTIPTWNRRELLELLLDDLRGQTYPAEEVVVVDNGSQDGSAEAATAHGATVIRMSFNAGFCVAVNRALEHVQTPWVAIVNNDVRLSADWLEQLLTVAEKQKAWFATGKLLQLGRPGIIDGTYDLICRGGCAWRAGHGHVDGPEWDVQRTIHFPPFTAVLLRTALFEVIGQLDERLESYLEDVDFGMRAALLGYTGIYVPGAVAYHIGSSSMGRWHPEVVRRIARNQLLLVAKHYPAGCLLRCFWPVLAAQTLWGLVALRHGAGLAFLRGKLEGLKQFRSFRSSVAQPRSTVGRLRQLLNQSENDLYDLQRRTRFDFYWKAYFTVT